MEQFDVVLRVRESPTDAFPGHISCTASSDLQEDDVLFEEELVRSPYALRTWLDYVASKKSAPAKTRFQLYERALKNLPGSYKLWRAYIAERVDHVRCWR